VGPLLLVIVFHTLPIGVVWRSTTYLKRDEGYNVYGTTGEGGIEIAEIGKIPHWYWAVLWIWSSLESWKIALGLSLTCDTLVVGVCHFLATFLARVLLTGIFISVPGLFHNSFLVQSHNEKTVSFLLSFIIYGSLRGELHSKPMNTSKRKYS